MTCLDGNEGNHLLCDFCGTEFFVTDEERQYGERGSGLCIKYDLWDEIWRGRTAQLRRVLDDVDKWDFCRACAIRLTPWISRLRDIDELRLYANRLERTIREIQRSSKSSVNS